MRLTGRDVFRAFKYSPQALHMVDPVGDLRHKGVVDVAQLLSVHLAFLIMSDRQNHRKDMLTYTPGQRPLNWPGGIVCLDCCRPHLGCIESLFADE